MPADLSRLFHRLVSTRNSDIEGHAALGPVGMVFVLSICPPDAGAFNLTSTIFDQDVIFARSGFGDSIDADSVDVIVLGGNIFSLAVGDHDLSGRYWVSHFINDS